MAQSLESWFGAADILRIIALLFATLLVVLPAGWATLALCYQAPGARTAKIAIVAVWIAFSVAALIALWQGWGPPGLAAFAAAFAVLMFWWRRIPPSNDK